jgi:hypothetical protein
MWRSFFLALGLFSIILGVESMLIDRAVVVRNRDTAMASVQEIVPPEWAPWSLMAAGAVVVLYSFTIPKKLKGGS